MNKIIKNISLNEFKNYSLNPKLWVWDVPIPPRPRLNNTDKRGDYTIAANIKMIFELPDNPYYKFTYLSFGDCKRLFKDLHEFQTLSQYICSLCVDNSSSVGQDNLSQFIDIGENWYYKEGDRIYPYLHFLLTDDFREEKDINNNTVYVFEALTYTPMPDCFLDYFITQIRTGFPIRIFNNSTILNIFSTSGAFGRYVNNFIKNYIVTEDKLGQIIDLIYEFILNEAPATFLNSVLRITEYDIHSDIKSQCHDYVFARAMTFYELNSPCVNKVRKEAKDYPIYEYDPEPPIIKLPILLNGDIDDMGVFTSTAKEWVPGQRYYLNDVVIYDDQLYILKVVNNEGYYAGDFNHIENIIYFDDTVKNTTTGYFERFRIVNNEFVHWKLTVDNRCISPRRAVSNNTGSLLYTLKGLVSNIGDINFFDVEGKYKLSTNRNISQIEGLQYYASRIIDRVGPRYYNANNNIVSIPTPTLGLNLSDMVDELTISGEIVKREIIYTYRINTIFVGTQPQVGTGILYTDTITSEVISGVDLEWGDYVITTVAEHTPFSFRYEDSVARDSNVFVTPTGTPPPHSNNEMWVNTPLIKEEYLFGVTEKPRIENNISVERGIVYSQDRHMAMGEIKTFSQMLTYNNGAFWRVFDNTKPVDEEPFIDEGALLGVEVNDELMRAYKEEEEGR